MRSDSSVESIIAWSRSSVIYHRVEKPDQPVTSRESLKLKTTKKDDRRIKKCEADHQPCR